MLCLLSKAKAVMSAGVVRMSGHTTCSVVCPPCIPDFRVTNEPPLQYLPDSCERQQLAEELHRISSTCEEIPIVIGNEYIYEGTPQYQVIPHKHKIKIVKYYLANEETLTRAINTAKEAQVCWDRVCLEQRLLIWMCAAQLVAYPYRQCVNAATMLGQSKTVIQAELDSACKLADTLRFNSFFLKEHVKYRPYTNDPCIIRNSMRFRGIDGFVAAVTPFNSTSVAANLVYTPALMGNSVLWKPHYDSILSNWRVFNIFREAGLPDGVVNFVPAVDSVFKNVVTDSRFLAGLNYAGNTEEFDSYWLSISENIGKYRNYPRLVGDCGGKSFHFVHPSADVDTVVSCTIRSAFEYSGQKSCSCSRLYIPRSLYGNIVSRLIKALCSVKTGDVTDNCTFTGAVINATAYDRIVEYIEDAKKSSTNKILAGGTYDKTIGYYIQPTIIEALCVRDKLMTEEIMGPILTIFTYEDNYLNQTLELVSQTTKYAMSGSVFATDPCFLFFAVEQLRNSAGNLYINDKSTGAVVGQQPFGGGHRSGTNDKSGGPHHILRWTTPQTIKEKFVPTDLSEIAYPYMGNS